MKHSVVSADAASTGGPNCRFDDKDFVTIARCAYDDFGLHLTEARKDLVYTRLIKRLRYLGLTNFADYCRVLEADDGAAERVQMLSALTTNVTHFFREEHHFQTLRETVLPPLIMAAKSGGRVRIWSAGCSAGQEPYSLAFTLLDLCPEAARLDIRVLATDVDPIIVSKARAGVYHIEELPLIPEVSRKRYTSLAQNGCSGFSIADEARALITFGELNLMQEWPISGPFDVLFCRNVAIYFDKPTQACLWNRLADLLAPGGYLFIGHSERVAGPGASKVEAAGITTYRKPNIGRDAASVGNLEGAPN